jgi:type III pantothenate kinase
LNICIDIGNTNAKAGVFEGEELLRIVDNLSDRSIIKLLKNLMPEHIIVSSVRKGIGRILKEAVKITHTVLFDHATPVPFTNAYLSPKTMGLDRIAAVAGARHLFPHQNCLVADIGTCITYELLDKNDNYHGGGISPGVEMRLKAMHKFTAKLPKLQPKGNVELIGRNTSECMLSGATVGALAEVEGIILKYQQYFEDLTIIFCGGGANFFESKIKGHIFAVPNLVLIGLNEILRFNLNE